MLTRWARTGTVLVSKLRFSHKVKLSHRVTFVSHKILLSHKVEFSGPTLGGAET